jgi:hypothetical protein
MKRMNFLRKINYKTDTSHYQTTSSAIFKHNSEPDENQKQVIDKKSSVVSVGTTQLIV